MKVDEKITLDNFQAQLESILSNIGASNTRLKEMVDEEDILKTRIAIGKKELNELTREIEDAKKYQASILASTKTQVKQINDASEQKRIEADEYASRTTQEVTAHRADALANLKRTVENHTQKITKLRSEESELETRVASLRNDEKNLKDSVAPLYAEVQSLSAEKENLDEDIILMKRQASELLSGIERLKERVKESEAKVLDADNHFKNKEDDIARRERDILVLTKRLRQLYQEVKPGVALKI